MSMEKQALEFIGLAYDAALSPDKWQQLMGKFITSIGANSALLREVNYQTGTVGLFETQGYDPAVTQAYRDHFVRLDYFAPKLLLQQAGDVTRGDEAVPWEQQRNTEYYNDYCATRDARYALGVTLARDQHVHTLFALQRSQRHGDFTDEEIQFIRLIAPHMTRAADIHRQLHVVTQQKKWAFSALDQLRTAVILLNAQGVPQYANCEAEKLLASKQGISLNSNGLRLYFPDQNSQLQILIKNVTQKASIDKLNTGGSFRFTTQNHETLQIHVVSLSEEIQGDSLSLTGNSRCVAIFISGKNQLKLSKKRLIETYGFTLAEARLSAQLAEGLSLEDASKKLSISIHTIRTQLKVIFLKAGVTRQSELVARLLSDILV